MRKPMPPRYRIALGALTAVLALALSAALLAVLGVGLANTPWGRHAIERATASWTDGELIVVGLAGKFPDDLRAARVELHDAQGTWASADDVHVQWSVARLLHGAIHLERVEAGRVQIARAPLARASASERASGRPPRIEVDRIALARVEIGAALAGTPAVVSIQGSAGIDWPQDGTIDLRMQRSDAPGSYTVKAWIDEDAIQADIDAQEPAHGLLAGLAGLGDLGAVAAQLHLHGARDAPVLQSALAAGALRAQASGSIDWNAQTLDLDVQGSAPAMAPRADLHWRSVALQARVHGPFRSPDATAQLRIDGLAAAGAQLRSLHADVQGTGGTIDVHATAEGVRIPGPAPELLQRAPLELRAQVRLDDPTRPASFTLSHPLLSLQGHAQAAAGVHAEFTVTVPQLAPFSTLAGTDLQGHTAFHVTVAERNRATQVELAGAVDLTGGSAMVQGLAGNRASFDAALALHAGGFELVRARVDAANLQASASGTGADAKLDLHWHAAIARLAALRAGLTGDIRIDGRLVDDGAAARQGRDDTLRLEADAKGTLGTQGFESRPIEASMRLAGLPGAPAGQVQARATLEDAPLTLAATLARRPGGDLQLTIDRAEWKSARVQGELMLGSGAAALTQARLQLQLGRLADLAPGVDPGLQGSAAASVELAPTPIGRARARIAAELHDLALADRRADQVRVTATVDDPLQHPTLAGQVNVQGLAIDGYRGSASLGVKGPLQALSLELVADLGAADEPPAHLNASAVLDTDTRRLALGALQARYRGNALQLLAPAAFSLRDGIAVDRLRVGTGGSVVELAGRLEPRLDLSASVRSDPSAGKTGPAPAKGSKGALAIDAQLTGDLAHGAAIDARISYGAQAQLHLSGQLPFSANEPVDLHAKGGIDAAIANPYLAATGRRVRGRVTMDMDLGGSWREPRIAGSTSVADGEFEDDNLGTHLTGIDAQLQGSGASVQIGHLTAKAGPGTLSVTGTVGPLANDIPIDLQLSARHAQPLASDFVVANVDADIHLHGALPARLDVAGTIKLDRADVTIPNALPPSVGVLDVRRAGQPPTPPATASPTVIGLDLKVDAPDAVFVHGRGIDAELGGTLTIAGTSASPQVTGGFDLRRGTFDLAGATLNFVSGRVGFNGTGLNRKIDPTLDFEAQSQSTSFTARLDVTGYASAPKISLSSTPDMPQDEILSQLLFGTSVNKLTALQMLQIGSAVASIGGLGSPGGGALSTVQKSLGLDRLSVGNTPTGATSVEAGRYVAKGVFVGARQMGTAGGTTQAIVQIDLTKQLKAVGAFGNGGAVQGATPDNDPGNSVGLLYQIEY